MPLNPYVYRLLEATAIDGDTVECVVDPGERMRWHRRLRLNGTDAPEAHSRLSLEREAAELVRLCVQEWIDGHKPPLVESAEKPEKFGRWLGDLHRVHPVQIALVSTCPSLATWLVENKLARRYRGEKKIDWTVPELEAVAVASKAILGR